MSAIEQAAQRLVLKAVEQGWTGPPFDPFELARILDIPVDARQELGDARVVPVSGSKVRIEYNPTRPAPRLRFSVAHEIAHTLFPDVARAARYRANPSSGPGDAWQLELLCNIAAGELLMPTESLPELRDDPLEIEHLLDLRKTYGVSTEALLRRTAKLTNRPAAMFAASRINPQSAGSPFRIDYAVGTRAWNPGLRPGLRVPASSVLAECTAIGFTAKRVETWSPRLGDLRVQGVGAPPFPGQRYPRILGLLLPRGVRSVPPADLEVLHGDATAPRGNRPQIIVHLVNDKTPNWRGGFAAALRARYPEAQEDFRSWVGEDRSRLRLGASFTSEVATGLFVATIVGQRGYGPSPRPRVRYEAIREALSDVARVALEHDASVHMPRIGAGQAGGRWPVVRELVEAALTRNRIRVTIYVPPSESIAEAEPEPVQLGLGV